MRVLAAAALVLSGCSLIYDPGDLTHGSATDAGGADAGPDSDVGPVPDTAFADVGPRPDAGACTLPPATFDWQAGARTGLISTGDAVDSTTGFRGVSVALVDGAAPRLLVATVDDGTAQIREFSPATGLSETSVFPLPAHTSAEHTDVAIRRLDDTSIGVITLGTPSPGFSGIAVGLADSGALGTLSTDTISAGADFEGIIPRVAVTGGRRNGEDTPGHFFWREQKTGAIWLASLEVADHDAVTGYHHDPDAMVDAVAQPIGSTAGNLVVLADASDRALLWDTRGASATPLPRSAVGRGFSAAYLGASEYVFGWIGLDVALHLRRAACVASCSTPDDCEFLACTDTMSPDTELAGAGALLAMEALPDRGYVVASTLSGDLAVEIRLFAFDGTLLAGPIAAMSVSGGDTIHDVAVDAIMSCAGLEVAGAALVGPSGAGAVRLVPFRYLIPRE